MISERKRRRRSVAVAGTVGVSFLGLAGVPQRALACSYLGCSASYAAPGVQGGATLPVNAPALVFKPGGEGAGPGDIATIKRIALFDAAGDSIAVALQPDPAAADHLLAVPEVPLIAGAAYRLVNLSWCGEAATLAPAYPAFNQIFKAAPASPLPTQIGTVAAASPAAVDVEVIDGSSCTRAVKASAAVLTITPTPEMKAYLHVARFTLEVDGHVEVVSAYGSYAANITFANAARRVDLPYQVCESNGAPWLGAGTHTAKLSAHIAGAAQDPPPVTFSFSLGCASSPVDAGQGDGGANTADATASTDAATVLDATSSDGLASAAVASPVAAGTSSGGCSMSPASAPTGAAATSLLAGLGLLVTRTRKRRPRG
jgi:hypothetical protein